MNCQRITIYALLILGYGGGFNERENVEYIEREESDGEYDEVISSALVCRLRWGNKLCISVQVEYKLEKHVRKYFTCKGKYKCILFL